MKLTGTVLLLLALVGLGGASAALAPACANPVRTADGGVLCCCVTYYGGTCCAEIEGFCSGNYVPGCACRP